MTSWQDMRISLNFSANSVLSGSGSTVSQHPARSATLEDTSVRDP